MERGEYAVFSQETRRSGDYEVTGGECGASAFVAKPRKYCEEREEWKGESTLSLAGDQEARRLRGTRGGKEAPSRLVARRANSAMTVMNGKGRVRGLRAGDQENRRPGGYEEIGVERTRRLSLSPRAH